MVDCYSEEDQSHQEAVEQRTTTFPLLDRDTLISVCDMDPVLTHASEGS